jgi:hypothetical protein
MRAGSINKLIEECQRIRIIRQQPRQTPPQPRRRWRIPIAVAEGFLVGPGARQDVLQRVGDFPHVALPGVGVERLPLGRRHRLPVFGRAASASLFGLIAHGCFPPYDG